MRLVGVEAGEESVVEVDRHRRWWGWLLPVLIAACTSIPGASDLPPAAPTAVPAWRIAAPETQGFDSVVLADALRALRDQDLAAHAVVIVRDRVMILDATAYPYDGTTPHQLGSVTKTVLTTLLGIAIDRGVVSLDEPVLSFFPDRTVANRDERKAAMTVRDLASMTSGLDCTAADDEATLRGMMASPDWVEFVLDLPVTADPGSVFRYCSPAMHLVSAILQETTGVTALEFARQFLFEPLGISEVRWATDPQGYARGWSDLYLLPRDLAKIGTLWERGGTWGERRILSEGWVTAARDVQVVTGGVEDYGFGWWIPRGDAAGTVEAFGHGGQLLLIRPGLHLVVVTAGSGMEPSRVVDPLLAGLVSEGAPLIAYPPGESSLANALKALRGGPDATTPTSPRSTVRQVSGVTWALETNPLGLATLQLSLTSERREGTVQVAFADGPVNQEDPIGLDGRFRIGLDRYRRPVAIRGSWAEGRTFVLEVDEFSEGHAYTLRLQFAKNGKHVTVEGLERSHDTGFVIEGVATD